MVTVLVDLVNVPDVYLSTYHTYYQKWMLSFPSYMAFPLVYPFLSILLHVFWSVMARYTHTYHHNILSEFSPSLPSCFTSEFLLPFAAAATIDCHIPFPILEHSFFRHPVCGENYRSSLNFQHQIGTVEASSFTNWTLTRSQHLQREKYEDIHCRITWTIHVRQSSIPC